MSTATMTRDQLSKAAYDASKRVQRKAEAMWPRGYEQEREQQELFALASYFQRTGIDPCECRFTLKFLRREVAEYLKKVDQALGVEAESVAA